MDRTIYDEDHEHLRVTARAFVQNVYRPLHEEIRATHHIPRRVWLEAGKLGLLGLEVPEAYGGGESGDWRFNAVLCEELAGFNMALSSCLGIHTDCVGPYLLDLATDEQQERWLPGFVTGEVVTAIAMTEPTAGSDLANLKSTAARDGDGWVLNGSKTFITNGASADLVIVAARTGGPGARGISLFLVDATLAGFERGKVLDKVGQPESDTSELFFTDVRLDHASLLGEEGKGFAYMMQRLPQERMSAAVGNLAHAAAILLETIAYAKERTAFGQPIGTFQHNKFLLADLVTRVEVTRAYVDQCVLAHAQHRLSAVDAAKAKWWSAEVQNHVLDACVQLHGGYGYMTEERVARAWMDGRVTKIWAGSNEIMKEVIGRDLGF